MSTTSQLPVSPADNAFARSRQPKPRLPNWVGVVGFFGLHLACLAVFFTGTTITALVLCIACYLLHMVGITVGYHRYFSHRSFKTSRVFQFILACLGCSALQKGPLWWAGHHRQHHRFADTADDPHSPLIRRWWWAHLGWVLAPDYNETDWRSVRDWNRYPELRWLNANHWAPAVVLAVSCWLIGGWSGLVWGFVISTVLTYHAVFAVNSLCHMAGGRRYATTDTSRNNLFVAVITLGEGWHNNHHHYQSSANQGFFWWEIDMSYYLIRLLGCVGLVWGIRTPPRAKIRERLLAEHVSALDGSGTSLAALREGPRG